MLLLIAAVMAASVLLFLAGLFVPDQWEPTVMALAGLASAAALSTLTAAWALGYQLTA